MPTLLYVAGANPNKVGGIERFCHELAVKLGPLGWNLVFCGTSEPPVDVVTKLTLPNLLFDKVEHQFGVTLKQAAEFAKIMLRYRPKIVMYHLGGTLRTFPIMAKLFGAKRVIYQDGTSRTSGAVQRGRFKRLATRVIAAPIDEVVAATEYVRRAAVEEELVPSEHISVIHNGVDVMVTEGDLSSKRAEWRRRFGISETAPVVMQLGWVVPEKGFDKLLCAAKTVVSQRPDTMFVMVGTGESIDDYRALGERLGIGNNVRWTGAVSSPFNDGAYAIADVYCQLSQWQEAGAYSLAEAMSYGLPMVVSNVGGMPETVCNGENGFVLEPTDIPGIARSILCLLDNCDLRRKFGENSRRIAMQHFNVRATTEQYVKTFGISGPAGPRRSGRRLM